MIFQQVLRLVEGSTGLASCCFRQSSFPFNMNELISHLLLSRMLSLFWPKLQHVKISSLPQKVGPKWISKSRPHLPRGFSSQGFPYQCHFGISRIWPKPWVQYGLERKKKKQLRFTPSKWDKFHFKISSRHPQMFQIPKNIYFMPIWLYLW